MRRIVLAIGLVSLLTAARPTLLSRAVAINAETGEFDTLLALAGQYPDAVAAQSGKGQLTLFVPTDQAFGDLFAFLGILGVAPSDPTSEQIARVLLYHVTAGRYSADRLSGTSSLTMLSGETTTISADGGVAINGANVIIADVASSNGFIHAIDAVLVPPSILADLGL